MAGACAGAGRGSKSPACFLFLWSLILIALSLIVKPSAGIIGFVTHPIEGTIKSIRSGKFQDVWKGRYLTLYKEGVKDLQESSQEERVAVVNKFMEFRYSSKGKGKGKQKHK